ncbi:class I SAM-dependent methyltransferase [Methylobacterium pseudosasicola]|uniref:Predicted nicotinamide N-methyase n=1 Tax=Methylobacterium pseudosasicola TaxID=582667 RepID=A0A1I4PLV2_9HYPH|nr:50S ribosomal protein L11 methyltransferase [Methylobacterium pseudosasicola]SFM28430.1 Predicted nicotinamide N-methyase [Methylobacterium pseudosasicola]
MRAPDDPLGFIAAHTRLLPVPYAPEIQLHVADEATALWQKTEDELQEIGLPPPFWAFAWAGGQALARYILDHPEIARGRRAVDFASGSGLVAIAAARAGAQHVVASDLDPFAVAAIGLNASANGVAGLIQPVATNLLATVPEVDLVFAADVFYERDLAEAVTGWLTDLQARGRTVLIGDPGRTYLPRARLECLASYAVPVSRALEDAEIKQSHVWRLHG